jgi:hypothetical protein
MRLSEIAGVSAVGSARVSRAGERVLAIANFSLASPPKCVDVSSERTFRRDAETSTRDARATLLQFAEPTQRDGRLCVIDFMAAAESPNSHSVEPCSLN